MATWNLDPEVTHLNHGSFGATPVEVLLRQQELRSELERNPVAFMTRTYQPLLELSRTALADFVGADPAGLVFVPNATNGVNSVLRSLESRISAGSEIVITTHTYNACRNAAAETAARTASTLIVADVPFPVASADQVVDAVLDVITPKTALVVLDHVTSATGLVLPIREIIETLEPVVSVLVDGAHAPGMIDVDIESLGASYYTANCHKWLCAPKGAAFLWVAERHRSATRAASISHGYNDGWPGSASSFHAQFDWTGTDDPTARLCVNAALEVMATHRAGGWPQIRATNHAMALAGREIVATEVGLDCPAPDEMIGSIASLALPLDTSLSAAGLTEALALSYHIEVPVFDWPHEQAPVVRVSAQQYNVLDDYRKLAQALAELLAS